MATTILSRYINDNEELKGWRFDPSDEVLVGYFLYNKIIGKELSEFQKMCVRDYDLYGDEEPFDIWDKFEGQENQDLFFITTLKNLKKRNNKKGLRYDRKVGGNGGNWHGEDAGKEFEVTVANCGTRKSAKATCKRFSYRNSKSDQHGLWIMLEYSLDMNDEYVVCRLRKNVRGANGVRGKKKRGFSAVAADATDTVANKRMRETLIQDDGLQSEFICENQNQKHESMTLYDPNLEVREFEAEGDSIEMGGGESESAANYHEQQEAPNPVEIQNVEEQDGVGDGDIGDLIDELMLQLDNGSELSGTFESNFGFEGEDGSLLKTSSFGQQQYDQF